MTEEQLNEEIYNRYGPVTRARGCFLYTKKGVRLTDMYQAGGRAILGWGGGDAFTRLKNVMNRGLTGSFKTEYDYQLKKAVSELLGCSVRVYFSSNVPDSCVLWEPWISFDSSIKNNDSEVFYIKPPLPWTDSIFLVCVKEGADFQEIPNQIKLPASLMAGITRSIYDLISEIQTRQEKDCFKYDKYLTSFFIRKGPYLYPKMKSDIYDDFVLLCLDCGIIVNPDYNSHSIVPFGSDPGVFSKLYKNEKRGVYAAG